MTPRSFDIDTCKEVVGDARMRTIEAKARQDADNGAMDAPAVTRGTYWDVVESIMEITIYVAAYEKRVARIQRMKERA